MGVSHSVPSGNASQGLRAPRNKLSKPKIGNHKPKDFDSWLPAFAKRRNLINTDSALEDRDRIREKLYSDIFEYDQQKGPQISGRNEADGDFALRRTTGRSCRRNSSGGAPTLGYSGRNSSARIGPTSARRRGIPSASIKRRRSLVIAPPPGTATRKLSEPSMGSNILELVSDGLNALDVAECARAETPSACSTIGVFKRGSLRIVNGAASPSPSVSNDYGFPKPINFDSVLCTVDANIGEGPSVTKSILLEELLGSEESLSPALGVPYFTINAPSPRQSVTLDPHSAEEGLNPSSYPCSKTLPFRNNSTEWGSVPNGIDSSNHRPTAEAQSSPRNVGAVTPHTSSRKRACQSSSTSNDGGVCQGGIHWGQISTRDVGSWRSRSLGGRGNEFAHNLMPRRWGSLCEPHPVARTIASRDMQCRRISSQALETRSGTQNPSRSRSLQSHPQVSVARFAKRDSVSSIEEPTTKIEFGNCLHRSHYRGSCAVCLDREFRPRKASSPRVRPEVLSSARIISSDVLGPQKSQLTTPGSCAGAKRCKRLSRRLNKARRSQPCLPVLHV